MQVLEAKNAICVHFCGKSNMSKIVSTATHKKAASPLILDLPLNIIYNTCLLK